MLFRKNRFAALVFISTIHAATLSGSAKIAPQDYIGRGKLALQTTYPACGMPYSELNLARITAVQDMNVTSTCGLCLKVIGTNTGKYIYVLAVDLGGSGLDLSVPSFEYLFNQEYDASPASWTTVDDFYCADIYTPGKANTSQGINESSMTTKSKTTTKAKTTTRSKTTAKAKTTTRSKTTAKSKTTPTRLASNTKQTVSTRRTVFTKKNYI